MNDAPGSPSRTPVYAAFALAFLFALLIFTPMHLAGWDHDVCFAVADRNGNIPRGILQHSIAGIVWGGLKRVTGFSVLGLVVWALAFGPFIVACLQSQSTTRRWVWIVPLLVSGLFCVWTLGLDPSGYHDCDRKGVSVALPFLPIMALAMNIVFAACVALSIRLFGKFARR